MPADAAWYANDIAVVAAGISSAAFVVSLLSVLYARRQSQAAEVQATEATKSRMLNEQAILAQAQALSAQSRDTAIALEIAERNAKAAEQSAQATKALAETGQRAWLSYEEPKILTRTRHQRPTMVLSTLRNGGSTPALDVTMYQCWKLYPRIPDVLDFASGQEGSRGGIGPGSTATIPIEVDITEEQDVRVGEGKEHLFVYGCANYTDVFGGKHKTEWCLWFVLETQQFTFAPVLNNSN